MASLPTDDTAILERFLETYWEDQRQGIDRGLRDYLDLFPGHEALIAGRFLSLQENRGEDADGDCSTLTGSSSLPGTPQEQWIERYRLISEIGRGGQAIVYRAEDSRLGREVAVKVLTGWGPQSETMLRRFRREAEMASRLNHPGICTIYDTGMEDQVAYIVMRLVPGQTLKHVIGECRRKGDHYNEAVHFDLTTPSEADDDEAAHAWQSQPQPLDEAARAAIDIDRLLRIAEKAARALHAAHEAGVVHRDITPGNVIVNHRGDPVILDFGLARDMQGNFASLTNTGDIFGTPAYMSPEQLAASRIPIDRRTDVYSLGVTLYECLTLHLPFEAPTREALYQAIMTKEPTDPRRYNTNLRRDLRVVILTAMEKDRDRRYATAKDFADELRRVLDREPVQARPAGPVLRLRRWRERNPRLANAIIGLFVVLALGLTTSLFLLGAARAERDAKVEALAQVAQLADLRRVRDLEEWTGRLWPTTPDKVGGPDGMNAWIRTAERLFGERLEQHRAALGVLRSTRSRRRTPDEVNADHEQNERENPEARDEYYRLIEELGELDQRHDATADQKRRKRRRIAELERVLRRRRTFEFSSDLDTLRHDALVELVESIERLPPRIQATKARRHLAIHLDELTIRDCRETWDKALHDIREVHDLELAPIRGLVPVGRDPNSGRFEFGHRLTGDIPERDASGRLVLTEETGLVFVLLPGGPTKVGARPENETLPTGTSNLGPSDRRHEGPMQEVELAPFLVSKYEMTQGQWLRVMQRNPSYYAPPPSAEAPTVTLMHPVEQVSWREASLSLHRLELELPTECQWEYAARGGTDSLWYTGNEATGLEGHANLSDQDAMDHYLAGWVREAGIHDNCEIHAPVGTFAPNPFGLHDVHGNVWEWCRDHYGHFGPDRPPRPGDGLRPDGPGDRRVARGGGFFSPASKCRAAARTDLASGFGNRGLGLRPVMPLPKGPR